MSSAPAGQLDSLLSLKSTPDMEVNSLQLDQVPASMIHSPQKPVSDPQASSWFGSSQPQSNNISMAQTPAQPETRPENPDETIPQIMTAAAVQTPKHTDTVTAPLPPASTATTDPPQPASQPQASPSKPPQPAVIAPQPVRQPVVKTEAIATVPGSSKAEQPESRSESSQGNAKVSAYARLEFENFIFYVQTLQVILGRKSENDQSHSVDVHLGASKAISRKHAKIFYNFGTERFELSIQGKNGAFVDDSFLERGATVPLTNKSKVQIGQIVFRFVLPGSNPQEKGESPSKPLNPSEAVSLKSALYSNQGSNDDLEKSGSNTPKLTANNTNTTEASAATATASQPAKKPAKEKKPARAPKPPKKVYTLEEIPEEYRTKPNCSYSNLIATCLRTHGTPKGMSLAEIYKSIRDIFPYYKYCPDGWQSSVRHNLSLNKAFRKVSKEGKGWLWGLDEEYCAEKERAKKKQLAAAAAKAKAAALKMEQQQQQKPQPKSVAPQQQQQQFQQGVVPSVSPQTQQLPMVSNGAQPVAQQAQSPLVQQQMMNTPQPATQTPQPQVQLQQPRPVTVAPQPSTQSKTPSIQAQLAANRGVTPSSATRVTPPAQQAPQRTTPLGADTKKALSHLQQQLVMLSKDLRNLVDKPTISAILTQAIAMTIAQVTQAAKTKGITTDPLATLIETNPQQLTKILTVALNAATYKVTNGRIKNPLKVTPSAPTSKGPTPAPSAQSTPQLSRPQLAPATSTPAPAPQQKVGQALTKVNVPIVPLQKQVQSVTPNPVQQQQRQPQRQQAQLQTQQSQSPVPPPQVHAPQPHQSQPSAQASQNSTPAPSAGVAAQVPVPVSAPQPGASSSGLQTAPHLQKSSSPSPVQSSTTSTVPQTLSGVTAQSTPYPQLSHTNSPQVQPQSEPSTSHTNTNSPGATHITTTQTSTASAAQETPGPKVPVIQETPQVLKPEVSPIKSAEATVGSIPPTPMPSMPPQPDKTQFDPVPVVKSDAAGPDLSFLNDDLNDPEFDKVLQSLSKEGTPGADDAAHQNVMDDEELNRLLNTDFSQPAGSKRTFDDVEKSLTLLDDQVNKIAKTE